MDLFQRNRSMHAEGWQPLQTAEGQVNLKGDKLATKKRRSKEVSGLREMLLSADFPKALMKE